MKHYLHVRGVGLDPIVGFYRSEDEALTSPDDAAPVVAPATGLVVRLERAATAGASTP